MKVVFKKTKGNKFGFTFPACDAKLDKSVVKMSKISPALRRIAKQLHKQFKAEYADKPIVGVEFHAVTFTFLLGEAKDTEGRYGHS